MDKSAHIRVLLAKQPGLSPKAIQAALASQGIEVERNLCKVVRHRMLNTEKAVGTSERSLRAGEARIERLPAVRVCSFNMADKVAPKDASENVPATKVKKGNRRRS